MSAKASPADLLNRTMNPAEDGLPKPQRYWAILTLMVGLSRSCPAGARRRRGDERQHGARALYLSAPPIGPRHRPGVIRRGGVVGGRPERRGGDPGGSVVAVALRDQRADRHRHPSAVVPVFALHSAERASL